MVKELSCKPCHFYFYDLLYNCVGKHKIMKLLAVILSLLLVPATFAIEGTARPVFDSNRELEVMRMVPVCAQGTPIVVSGTRLVCGRRLAGQTCPTGQALIGFDAQGQMTCAAVQNLAGQTCPANQAIAGFNAQGNIVCRAISTGGGTPTPPPTATGCGSCPAGYPHLLSIGGRCSSNNDTFICGR